MWYIIYTSEETGLEYDYPDSGPFEHYKDAQWACDCLNEDETYACGNRKFDVSDSKLKEEE